MRSSVVTWAILDAALIWAAISLYVARIYLQAPEIKRRPGLSLRDPSNLPPAEPDPAARATGIVYLLLAVLGLVVAAAAWFRL